jgi:hypothetical protein
MRLAKFIIISAVAILWVAAAVCVPARAQWQEGWKPVPWPFLRDGWPNGIAFDCTTCGGSLSLYVRVKVGFCDCSRGVSDDDEIDRVGDVDLVIPEFQPDGAGRIEQIAGVRGRVRLYRSGERRIATLAAGRDCNAIVATAVSRSEIGPESLAMSLARLSGPDVLRFIDDKMSGR